MAVANRLEAMVVAPVVSGSVKVAKGTVTAAKLSRVAVIPVSGS